jgi:hypothetical protein
MYRQQADGGGGQGMPWMKQVRNRAVRTVFA